MTTVEAPAQLDTLRKLIEEINEDEALHNALILETTWFTLPDTRSEVLLYCIACDREGAGYFYLAPHSQEYWLEQFRCGKSVGLTQSDLGQMPPSLVEAAIARLEKLIRTAA